jgi:hypothetical protein
MPAHVFADHVAVFAPFVLQVSEKRFNAFVHSAPPWNWPDWMLALQRAQRGPLGGPK